MEILLFCPSGQHAPTGNWQKNSNTTGACFFLLVENDPNCPLASPLWSPIYKKTRTPLPFPPVSQYRISTDRKVFRSCSELRKQPHLWRVWSMFLLMSQAPICLVRFIHSCNRIPWVADIVGTQLGDKNATEAGCDWNYYNAVLWMNERSLLGEWTMVGWWGFTGSVATQAACYLRGDWFDGWRR